MHVENGTFVALLSGGLDSAAAVALAAQRGLRGVLALTFDYGQQAASREAAQAGAIAAHYRIPHFTIALPWFRLLPRRGALVDATAAIPEPVSGALDDKEAANTSAAAVWVPNRNGVFLNIAAGFAESHGAEYVLVGFNREEATTFPDNSADFAAAATTALAYSTANSVAIHAPTVDMSKAEIVHALRDLDFPWAHLWSCYRGGARMCGRCESCQRLARATQAGGMGHAVSFDAVE